MFKSWEGDNSPILPIIQIENDKDETTKLWIHTNAIAERLNLNSKKSLEIFSDQFESRLPGRVFSHRGSSLKYDVYKGGTIFCDCATNYVKIYHQSSFSECDTVI